MLAKLALLDMPLIKCLGVENLLRVDAFSIVETNIAILFFVPDIQVFFELVETVEHFVALFIRTVVAGFILNLFCYLLVGIVKVRVFLNKQ